MLILPLSSTAGTWVQIQGFPPLRLMENNSKFLWTGGLMGMAHRPDPFTGLSPVPLPWFGVHASVHVSFFPVLFGMVASLLWPPSNRTPPLVLVLGCLARAVPCIHPPFPRRGLSRSSPPFRTSFSPPFRSTLTRGGRRDRKGRVGWDPTRHVPFADGIRCRHRGKEAHRDELAAFSDSVSYLWRWLRRKDWRDGMGEGQATPVLLLSGFLGAGKTTTLRHWIQNQRGLKLGCVVNDVASVNIDAKLIRRTHDAATSTLDLADTVELDNGCACCSITDELFDAIENLCYLADSRKQRFDWIVIEASGVAEPQNVRDLFQNAQEDKLPVSKMAYLDRIVTVVDASAFGEHYASKQMLVEKPELGEGGGRRPVVDLLIEQVECADFVLINKADRVKERKVQRLQEIIATLNPLCTVQAARFGNVILESVLNCPSILPKLDLEGQHRGAIAAVQAKREDHHHGHQHGHGHDHPRDQEHNHACEEDEHEDIHRQGRRSTSAAVKFGITSFVYSRRRPFHTKRLRALVLEWTPVAGTETNQRSPLQVVLRSKGFVWLSGSHTNAHYWSHAGQHLEIKDVGNWWDAVARSEWPTDQEAQKSILNDFSKDESIGDRRQELVFIGIGMDQATIESSLDQALLSDEELGEYKEYWTC